MVDSRQKGQRGEYLVRDLLREATGIKFERVPASGALSYLKGDIYIPNAKNKFCIEVKNYEKSPISDKVFTNKTNYLVVWWEKIQYQAEAQEQEPLLFVKYSRSKVFVVTKQQPTNTRYMQLSWMNCYVMLAEEWIKNEKVDFNG
ncbi:MAG: hypothetical protein VW518_00525 [Burkholderiaceae bacterium]